MKKISKVSVSSKAILTSRYFRVLVILLLIVLAVMSSVLIKVYVDVNQENKINDSSDKNNIVHTGNSYDEYTVFENEDGFLGVSEKKSGRLIIEPVWENVYVLCENRFIVGRTLTDSKKMGIIDIDSNIVVPFIFNSFRSFSDDFIGGFTGNGDEFILFDKYGEPLSDRLWTNGRYSNGVMYLNDSDDEYRCRYVNDEFRFIFVGFQRNPDKIPLEMTLTDPEKIRKAGIGNLNRIADIADRYLKYLFSGGGDISELTSEQYYSALSSNDFFKGCKINAISDFSLEITEEKIGTVYNVRMIVSYDYKKNEVEMKNISSEIIFIIVSDENNRLVLKNINKKEL